MTTTTTVIQDSNAGGHYAPGNSMLEGSTRNHKPGMAPLATDECGDPLAFSPLDFSTDGGNMVLWDDVRGGAFPWDPRYFQDNPDTSDGFDPTYIMQHATDSASTAGTMATGHKAAVGMMSQDLYEEDVSTLVEDAMYCGKAGGVVSSVTMLHATPGAFVAHSNNRRDTDTLQKSFANINPTAAAGVCNSGYYPKMFIESMESGPMSAEWTVLKQSKDVMAEVRVLAFCSSFSFSPNRVRTFTSPLPTWTPITETTFLSASVVTFRMPIRATCPTVVSTVPTATVGAVPVRSSTTRMVLPLVSLATVPCATTTKLRTVCTFLP